MFDNKDFTSDSQMIDCSTSDEFIVAEGIYIYI